MSSGLPSALFRKQASCFLYVWLLPALETRSILTTVCCYHYLHGTVVSWTVNGCCCFDLPAAHARKHIQTSISHHMCRQSVLLVLTSYSLYSCGRWIPEQCVYRYVCVCGCARVRVLSRVFVRAHVCVSNIFRSTEYSELSHSTSSYCVLTIVSVL